ncbi:MAG: hypothetical protein AAGN35_24695 [Bacteroidota bacterium]
MKASFEPYSVKIKRADDSYISFMVDDLENYKDAFETLGWKKAPDLIQNDSVPIFKNGERILEVVLAQGVCYLFDDLAQFKEISENLIVFFDNGQVLPFELTTKLDYDYLSSTYSLKRLDSLSKSPSEFFELPDGRIPYIDENWKEGMLYRNLEEFKKSKVRGQFLWSQECFLLMLQANQMAETNLCCCVP